MAKHIVIHAGQHKTGSKSIQRYISDNTLFLRRHGLFPCPEWKTDLTQVQPVPKYNAAAIAHAMLRTDLLTPVRLKGRHEIMPLAACEAGIERVNAYLRALPEDTAIVSAEAFSFMRTAQERALLDMLCDGMAMRSIIFLREPRAWRESWRVQVEYGQLIEQPGAEAGVGIFDFSETSWLTDHAAIRAFWGEQCTFISYEDAVANHGSVIPAFLAAVGLDPSSCPPWDKIFLNSSARKLERMDKE